MENQKIRRQVAVVSVEANASGVIPQEVQIDIDYSKVVGVTIYNKGSHVNYDVGFKRVRGAQIEDVIPFEHYEKTNLERSLPTNWPISNDKIVIQTSIDSAEANAILYKIVFTLEK